MGISIHFSQVNVYSCGCDVFPVIHTLEQRKKSRNKDLWVLLSIGSEVHVSWSPRELQVHTHTLQEESSHPGGHNLSRVDPDWIGDDSGGENVVPERMILDYAEEKELSHGENKLGMGT